MLREGMKMFLATADSTPAWMRMSWRVERMFGLWCGTGSLLCCWPDRCASPGGLLFDKQDQEDGGGADLTRVRSFCWMWSWCSAMGLVASFPCGSSTLLWRSSCSFIIFARLKKMGLKRHKRLLKWMCMKTAGVNEDRWVGMEMVAACHYKVKKYNLCFLLKLCISRVLCVEDETRGRARSLVLPWGEGELPISPHPALHVLPPQLIQPVLVQGGWLGKPAAGVELWGLGGVSQVSEGGDVPSGCIP